MLLNVYVWRLRVGPRFLRVLDQAVVFLWGTHRLQHDHAVAQCELRMGYTALVIGDYQVSGETERLAKPFDGGGRVNVAHSGDNVALGKLVHGLGTFLHRFIDFCRSRLPVNHTSYRPAVRLPACMS